MINKIKIYLLFLALFTLGACIENVSGEYSGELPLGYYGVQVNLTLNPDNTFKIKMFYPQNDEASFEETGTYIMNTQKIITLNYPGDGIKFLKPKDNNYLYVLTTERKIIGGENKDKFLLKKQKNLYL